MSDDPRAEPPDLGDETPTPAEPPAWRMLVRVLTNHIAVLEDVKQRVSAVRDRLEERQELPRRGEIAELARAHRDQADSATDVARSFERLERRGTRGATR